MKSLILELIIYLRTYGMHNNNMKLYSAHFAQPFNVYEYFAILICRRWRVREMFLDTDNFPCVHRQFNISHDIFFSWRSAYNFRINEII